MVRTTFKSVQPLTSPTYADLNDIGRCLHIDDFEEAMERGYLVSQRLTNSHKRLLKQVLWFAPCQSMSTHNYYGNVTFVVKWETVLQKLGPNLYLIDQAIYNARSFTRVVLTNANYDNQLDRVDLNEDGSALIKQWTGYRHVNHCFNKQRRGPHELQIAIEVDQDDARWLFQHCTPVPNDHSLSNILFSGNMPRKGKYSKYESYKCFKFNTAQNKECPYEFTSEQCRDRVQALLGNTSTNARSEREITFSPAAASLARRSTPVRSRIGPDEANENFGVFPASHIPVQPRQSQPAHFEDNYYREASDSLSPESRVPAFCVRSWNSPVSTTTAQVFHPPQNSSLEPRMPVSPYSAHSYSHTSIPSPSSITRNSPLNSSDDSLQNIINSERQLTSRRVRRTSSSSDEESSSFLSQLLACFCGSSREEDS